MRAVRFWPVVPVLGLALAGACSGGGGGSSTTSAPVTTTVPVSTTLAGGATTTTGRSSTVASRPTGTEPASTALADGTYPVYLAGVNTAARTVSVDVVQVLDRSSPEASSVCPEIASGGIDGYCIKNANPRLRTLPVAPSASLRVLTGSDLHSVDIGGLAAARHSPKELSFFEITVAGGKVTAAKEIYRP